MALDDLISMYGIDSITGTTSTSETTSSDELDKNQFLLLLITQLKNQDPLEPMKNEDFIAQLATFSSLEQMVDLNDQFGQMLSLDTFNLANTFIGKEVYWFDGDGEQQSGIVDYVELYADEPYLYVGETGLTLSSIYAVGLPTEEAESG